MKLAIQTPPEHTDFSRLRDLWQAADQLGFSAGFTFDHFVPLNPGPRQETVGGVPSGPQFEGWVVLAALGAVTSKLEVGTLVTGVTYRHPALLAKMAVTLDHVTAGRAVLGVGAAWHDAEHAMYGVDYPAVGDRMALLEETVEAFRLLCDSPELVSYSGRFVNLNDAVFDPMPLRPNGIPVLIGGGGERLRRIAARCADWYNGFWAPWEWDEVNKNLDVALARYGRQPADLKRTAFVFSELSGDQTASNELVAAFQANRGGTSEEVRSRVLAGSPDDMISVLRAYEDAGVEMVILNIRPSQQVEHLQSFAELVLPAVVGD